MMNDKNLNIQELYCEFKMWREAHPDSIYIILRSWTNFDGKNIQRYIVAKGVEICRFFGDVIVETISGQQQLSQPITCASEHEASQLCQTLNSKLVHDTDPELFKSSPTWQESYNRFYMINENA